MSADLTSAFAAAQARIKTRTRRPANDDLLDLYGLYKQATEGDIHGEPPGVFDFVAKAKYNAWESRRGMSGEEAMQRYIDLVDRIMSSDT
ncbi:MAG: acyl-CoA-binding protein [Bacteroidia bacterium]